MVLQAAQGESIKSIALRLETSSVTVLWDGQFTARPVVVVPGPSRYPGSNRQLGSAGSQPFPKFLLSGGVLELDPGNPKPAG